MARKLKRRAIFQVVHYIQSPQIGVSFLPSRSQAKDLSSRDLGLFGMILSETKTMKAQGFHAGLLFRRCFSRFLPSFCLPNHTRGPMWQHTPLATIDCQLGVSAGKGQDPANVLRAFISLCRTWIGSYKCIATFRMFVFKTAGPGLHESWILGVR